MGLDQSIYVRDQILGFDGKYYCEDHDFRVTPDTDQIVYYRGYYRLHEEMCKISRLRDINDLHIELSNLDINMLSDQGLIDDKVERECLSYLDEGKYVCYCGDY